MQLRKLFAVSRVKFQNRHLPLLDSDSQALISADRLLQNRFETSPTRSDRVLFGILSTVSASVLEQALNTATQTRSRLEPRQRQLRSSLQMSKPLYLKRSLRQWRRVARNSQRAIGRQRLKARRLKRWKKKQQEKVGMIRSIPPRQERVSKAPIRTSPLRRSASYHRWISNLLLLDQRLSSSMVLTNQLNRLLLTCSILPNFHDLLSNLLHQISYTVLSPSQ